MLIVVILILSSYKVGTVVGQGIRQNYLGDGSVPKSAFPSMIVTGPMSQLSI